MKIIFNPQELAILKKIYNFSRKQRIELFLVGGIIRDKILRRKKENPDIDFCLKEGAISFGKMLSRKLKGGFVVLDEEHGACRLVYKTKDKIYTLDFADFRGLSLEGDLLRRDFTINSMAARIEDVVSSGRLDSCVIDPYGGRGDLKDKLLRMSYPQAFDEDPLRILRAFSLSSLLNFKIEDKTLASIKSKKKKILSASYERIRDELFKIFDTPSTFRTLTHLDELKILEVIIPEINKMRGIYQGPYHHLDIWKHTLESIGQFEKLIVQLQRNKDASDYLNEFISGQRRRMALIKFALLLHDIGKPATRRRYKTKVTFHGHERSGLLHVENISKRLRLSNEELRSLKTMVLWHLRPGYLGDLSRVTDRARYRYFRDAGQEAPGILLLSVADQRATRGPLSTPSSRCQHERVAFSLLKEYFRRKKEKKLVRLVNGNDLIRKLGLKPSPLIGKILKELEELQVIGSIRTKKAALEHAARMLKNA